ncbi:hypothetical protein [Devosia sp. SL43]|uniref:hypothetical protein n=1 Tax=Devosia sp. SL43 TaxID=2806348 RepID=UPI001F447F04|nr:hypothetical protein [Devosia sp. SL43]UJW85873.1 hypothetical protein IM737_00800 [Devosia sp. SL43]
MASLLSPGVKKGLNLIGSLLAVSGIVFVGLLLWDYSARIDLGSISLHSYAAFIVLAAVYGASNVLLARGWWSLLGFLNVTASWTWALQAYATSQLAKYVPGNIFQFAGRQVIGVAAGIDGRSLVKSTGLELAMLVLGGVMFAPLVLSLLIDSEGSSFASVAAFAVILVLVISVILRFFGWGLIRASMYYLGFIGISGAVFLWIIQAVGGVVPLWAYPSIAGAYVIAWLAGLVTPGAPAGLGVREAVLLFLLREIIQPDQVLLAVVVGRVVTIFGDVGFYIVVALRTAAQKI